MVFADTSFFIALTSRGDVSHDRATNADIDKIITTDYILVELGNYFSRSHLRPLFLDVAQDLQNDDRAEVVPATRTLLQRGLALYQARPDKDWSLTDCISFVVMQDHDITEALTADRHFEHAGYVPLLVRGGVFSYASYFREMWQGTLPTVRGP